MLRNPLAIVVAVVAAILVAAMAVHLSYEREAILAQARSEAGKLGAALAEYTQQTVAGLDLALLGLTDELQDEPIPAPAEAAPLATLLAERQAASPATEALFLLDAAGRLVATSSGPAAAPTDLSGLPGFVFHRGAAEQALHIGRARQDLQAVTGDRWVVDVTRRITGPGGSFAGVIGAALSLDKLIAFQETLIGPGGTAGILATDGSVLVRAPFDTEVYGQNVSQGVLFELLRSSDSGVYTAPALTDGVSRITAFQRLERFPLVTYVALAEQERMNRWWLLLAAEVAVAVLLVGAMVAVVRHLLRSYAQRAREEEARRNLFQSVAEGTTALIKADSAAEVLKRIESGAMNLTRAGGGQARLFAEGEAPPPPSSSGERLTMPIRRADGQEIGLLELSGKAGGGRFGEDDRWAAHQLAEVGGAVLERQQADGAREAALVRAETETAAAVAARAETERVYSSIVDAVAAFDRSWRMVYANRNTRTLTGLEESAMLGQTLWELFPQLLGTVFESEVRGALENGEPAIFEFEQPESERWFAVRAYPQEFGITVYLQDISDRKQTEAQLRQAQRMEAVGQLTGGVAHDFNNLLTVILGNVDDMVENPAITPELKGQASMVLKAAERAADLTQRLLAFSRRQALDPRAVDVNELVGHLQDLIQRTIGEAVETVFIPARDLEPAMVDAGQLENAILNLVINSQHAMPDGGKLTIETQNVYLDKDYADSRVEVREGHYVMVSVADTGVGMSRETIERAFEPFFTTKPAGIGTGLGLSMIYGFIKQSRGHIGIYSELGQGTIVKIYLPRAVPESAEAARAEPAFTTPRGNERILVVEDDELVRRHAVATLIGLGYRVTATEDGPGALRVFASEGPFDLLLVDVVLAGGMNGRQVAETIKAQAPDIRILFMSGYTENAIVHHGRLDSGVQLLGKPFRRTEIAAKVRKVLDQ